MQINARAVGQLVRNEGYQSDAMREIHARASTLHQNLSEAEKKGVHRLNKTLNEDPSPRTNVPRGFYLNIEV